MEIDNGPIDRLLARLAQYRRFRPNGPTPEEKREAEISFVLGNLNLSTNHRTTREDVERAHALRALAKPMNFAECNEVVHTRRALAALKSAANRTGEPLGLVEPTDPRERMLMLYREWVKCRPHQVHLKAHIEGAIVRCRTRIEMGAWR